MFPDRRAEVELRRAATFFPFVRHIRPIADGLWYAVLQAVGNGWNGPSSFPLAEIFSRPLGAPNADAVVADAAAGVFTRSFEHLEVKVNVSAWSAELQWS